MKPVKELQIGKNGLTDGLVEHARKLVDVEKLIKISILKTATRDKEEAKKMADNLVEKLGKQYTYTMLGYVITLRR